MFVIIPKYAPQDQQEIIKDWLGLGFSGLLLAIAMFQTKFTDPTLLTPVVFYLFVVAFIVSGVYWWIPKYVKPSDQNEAIKYIFISTTIAIIIVNGVSPAMAPTMSALNPIIPAILGGRRRR
jgi:hypothetical protein